MSKFVIVNISKTDIGFTVYTPSPEGSEFMSKHKQRKFRNAGNIYVCLKPNTSVDLVELTGMSTKDLMDNPEVLELVRSKTHKTRCDIEEDSTVVEEDEETSEAEVAKPIEEIPVEEIPVEEIPSVEEIPKKKKVTKKKAEEKMQPPVPTDIMPPALSKGGNKQG